MSKYPGMPEWATEIPIRSPVFKIHTNKGHAYAALGDKFPDYPGKILKWNGKEWVVVEDFVPPTNCENCEGSLNGARRVSRKSKRLKIHRVVLCHDCYYKENGW